MHTDRGIHVETFAIIFENLRRQTSGYRESGGCYTTTDHCSLNQHRHKTGGSRQQTMSELPAKKQAVDLHCSALDNMLLSLSNIFSFHGKWRNYKN